MNGRKARALRKAEAQLRQATANDEPVALPPEVEAAAEVAMQDPRARRRRVKVLAALAGILASGAQR